MSDLSRLKVDELRQLAADHDVEPEDARSRAGLIEALEAAGVEAPVPDDSRRPIERVNAAGSWWCPFCDHSQTGDFEKCQGCGAVRDGDEVRR